ncbi:MAG: hypothetical protein NVSMB55_09400 [Mycobacteriales bacterium]
MLVQTPGAAAPRSGLLTAWGNAWLAGHVTLPDLVSRVAVLDDDMTVTGLWVDDLPLGQAMTRLRADAVVRLRVVLPAPGDVLGLPVPGPFTPAALAVAEGVLAVREDGSGTGLVPAVTAHGSAYEGTVTTVLWTAYDITAPIPDPGPHLPDAEHDLRRGLVECVELLRTLDVARWRPELAGALQDLRTQARRGLGADDLPGSHPVRARQLLAQARQLAGVLSLATVDAGGAIDTRETAARERALRDLEKLVRRARVAAYNSPGLE